MIAMNHPSMTVPPNKGAEPVPPPATSGAEVLLSDEPTIELVLRAREGNREAVEALLERCIPQLKR